ncbi:NB-ARC domain-containing protein [Streptomyces sp. NPDC001809]
MTLDGGRVAARGFQYQYLRTVEALLAGLVTGDVAACRVEGPAGATSVRQVDCVDFDLVDAEGRSLVAVQVKSAGPTRVVRARDAVAVLLHLVTGFDSAAYRLITSASPNESCLRLAELLRLHGADVPALRRELEDLLRRAPATWALCEALTPEQWERLGRAEIEFDPRDEAQLRQDLGEALRVRRERSGRGLSARVGGFVLGYLVAEVMRRAADPGLAEWDVEDFRSLALAEDEQLIAAVGRQDFGLVYGPMPRIPEVARPDLVAGIDAVVSGGPGDSGGVPVCVVTGLSGLGKSSLAAAYVAEHAYRYDTVFWVEAETEEALTASFARILGHLTGTAGPVEVTDPRLVRERVHALLQSLPGPWLMVFDDAAAKPTRPWLPGRGRGAVVVTSLGGNWRHARGRVEVGALSDEQAVELLRLRLELSEDAADRYAEVVSRLAEALERWPLAIEVACGYLMECGIGVARLDAYADTLLQRAADDEDSVPYGYPRTLAAAVALSVERLVASARPRGLVEPTLSTLAALCWLAPRRIPVHLALASAIVGVEQLPRSPGRLVLDEVEHPVREVFRELTHVSLVRYDDPLPARTEAFAGSEDTVSMNSVLQVVLARHLGLSGIAATALPQIAAHTDQWLLGAIETGEAERSWELAQHATALVGHIEDAGVADLHTCLLMGNLAAFHLSHGQYETAQRLLERELVRLEQAGRPDEGVAAQVDVLLAHIVQLREPAGAAAVIEERLGRVLSYLLALPAPLEPHAVDLAANAVLVLQTQLREGPHDGLTRLLQGFVPMSDAAPETEVTRALRDLADISELLSAGEAALAEQAAAAALAAVSEPWTKSAAELRRLLVEALVVQEKWPEADAALTDFLPFCGPRTLHAFSVHHLVHNAGLAAAWKWVTTGNERAVEFLGRLLQETGVDDNPEPEIPTDRARLVLLRVVHGMWRAFSTDSVSSAPMDLMRHLTDKTFTEPYDPDNVWERLYHGLVPRLTSLGGAAVHRKHQAESEEIVAAAGADLLADPAVRAVYEAAACHGQAAVSSDPAYAALGLTSDLDVLLPEFRHIVSGPRALLFLEPTTLLGVTALASGLSTELQLHRACDKGFRRLMGRAASVPSADGITLSLTGRDLVLEHGDGTVLARARVDVSGQWLKAARTRQTVVVYYGYGLDLAETAAHRRLLASPTALQGRLTEVGGQGLLATALVSVNLGPVPAAAPQEGAPSPRRTQPKRGSKRSRARRGR